MHRQTHKAANDSPINFRSVLMLYVSTSPSVVFTKKSAAFVCVFVFAYLMLKIFKITFGTAKD